MGSRASQLRNRQQVQDSSSPVVVNGVDDTLDGPVKQLQLNHHENNNNGIGTIDNNNINDIVSEVEQLKQELNKKDGVVLGENGDTQQTQAGDLEAQLANGNSASKKHINSQKGSTLQRQASHIQSLAQRIRRSSSLRTPKLKALIPSFVSGKRKVSACYPNF